MKTALFYGGKDIRVEDVPDPEPGPGEVLVRVRSAGICGSDLHNYRGHRPPTYPIPWQQGHELAGEVVALGPGVETPGAGQRVGIEAEHLVGCGECRHCRSGQYHICPSRSLRDGRPHGSHGFSELDACIARNCHPLPDNVAFDAAALVDCYACGVHALLRAGLTPGDTVAILGTGAIALTLGQVARAWGAGRVVMVGRRRGPLDLAFRADAADEVVLAVEGEPAKAIMSLTSGQGADLVFETVGGDAQLLGQAMAMARYGGTVSVLGLFMSPQTVDAGLAMRRELRVLWSNSYSTWGGVSEYDTALKLVAAGRVDPAPLITHHYPLERIAEAFAVAADKRASGAVRVMLHP
ncbi:MAG: alcohol dehydrogenase catalytic domain-containing protein [Gemmatimonadetes bacterium]|nr:alcohol dehydrogenase catalytic domain-containing protein [Gemmatimonadota bacterium]